MNQSIDASAAMTADDFYSAHYPQLWNQHCRLMNTLENQYSLSRPEAPLGAFRDDIFNKLGALTPGFCKDEGFDFRGLCEYIESQNPERLDSEIGWIYISCALALASEFWLSHKAIDLAWKFQCDAHYYCGLAVLTDRSQEIFTSAITSEYQVGIASQGGISKNLKYKKYHDRTIEILKTKTWPSVGSAANSIKLALQKEFAADEEISRAGGYKFTSVETWIKALPPELLDIHIPGYTQRRLYSQDTAKKLKEGKSNSARRPAAGRSAQEAAWPSSCD